VFSVTGSVPSMYREFYDAVCSASNDLFDRDLFVRVLSASGLSHEVLAQVFSFNVPYTVTVTEVYLYCPPSLLGDPGQGSSQNNQSVS